MTKFDIAKTIFKNYGFNFVKTDKEANIIIKSPSTSFVDENGKKFEKYKIIRAAHTCRTQIQLVTLTLLRLFNEHEDAEFIEKFGHGNYEGVLGENKFWVKI